MSSDADAYSYAYTEPTLSALLSVSSFLVALNLFRVLVENVISGAGLLGEISVGVIFGTPLAGILAQEWMAAFEILGYIGLCLMVLEGGLNTPLSHALPALPISLAIACTGMIAPIVSSLVYFSLILRPGYSLLHAFAAGAALSSTSLGTTFSVLSSVKGGIGEQIGQSKLGAVLMSAAMADDVVGLILLKVVVVLGSSSSTSVGWTIGRPLLASFGMLALSWILAKWLFAPLVSILLRLTPERLKHEVNLAVIVLLTTGYVAIASLAGTSPLLGAFIAGIVLAFLSGSPAASSASDALSTATAPSFRYTFEQYINPALSYILRPIFFASIGFAIPVKTMFRGPVVWKGMVYAIIMTGAKILCGAWLPATISTSSSEPAPSPPPTSLLLPTSLLGLAMVARGEIGLLIAQVAKTAGLLEDELFLVCIWATVLCTIFGPVSVGWVCRRWEKVGAGMGRWG
ncbi:Sodium/hydrogen exchanger [Gloeophyllum trabeum ATCC 11539]|uniref:Sodium/hydrogen exchanger n=1 Tax=Gloeophyllum trabeum (strain ATCC 11539 / FP-39264 / Madison 617) TaxID=670483 RepID=S7QLA9_GLOTA|nr:Sodium/hydrogen exchanger [Gloeophyllum trabeum ATCC 11539]EPQ60097.1 Sodium/hydrogen exchanger [Gloeophyllum trabeum ATCC 11539]